jgi:hypothetical protein
MWIESDIRGESDLELRDGAKGLHSRIHVACVSKTIVQGRMKVGWAIEGTYLRRPTGFAN